MESLKFSSFENKSVEFSEDISKNPLSVCTSDFIVLKLLDDRTEFLAKFSGC